MTRAGRKPRIAYIYFKDILDIVNTPIYQRPLSLSKHFDLVILVKGSVPRVLESHARVYHAPHLFSFAPLDFLVSIVWAIFKILAVSRESKVDFVETHSDYSHFVGYALHLLGFGWIADIWDNPEIYFESHPVFASVQLAFLKRKLRASDLVICVTHPDVLSDYGIDPERMLTQVNGVNLPSDEDIKDEDFSFSHPKKRIVYVGWVTFSRGIDILLKAFSIVVEQILDVELVLVGPSWDERERVEALIGELRIESNVLLTGEVPHSKALDLIRSSSIGVYPFPRARFLDNVYPVKVPEYLAYGKPVVSSDLKGVRRYIDHGKNGLLFKPGAPREFASMLIKLLGDPKLLTQMSSEARRSSFDFQWSGINAESLQATLELAKRREA